MDKQLCCYVKLNDEEIQLLLLILNQPDGKQLLQNYRKFFYIQLLEQIHFASQKPKHAKLLEWIVGIVNVLTLMETRNYM